MTAAKIKQQEVNLQPLVSLNETSRAGVYAPYLTLYSDEQNRDLATVAVQCHGGGAQIDLTSEQAKELATALAAWAETGKAAA